MDKRLIAGMLTPILPPLALYVSGDAKPKTLGISAALCLLFWVPAAIHAYWTLGRG
jgi:uncharacterized membrane protein YqaE (UPF0057 family)